MKRAPELDCPVCGHGIVKSYGSETKLRSKVIKWDKSGMYAICKSCDAEIEITTDLMKSIESSFVFEVDVDKKVCNG